MRHPTSTTAPGALPRQRFSLRRAALAAVLLLIAPIAARADLCGDAVDIRFARFPSSATETVSCSEVELPCAAPELGLFGSCRFAIDIDRDVIRIDDFTVADYGSGATLTFSDLDSLLCDGTVPGELVDVEVEFVNSSGFVPEVVFDGSSVEVSLAKGVTRWKPGDFVELQLEFAADCPDAATNHRSGWVPNVGFLATHELPLGDLYTFHCPAGGQASAFVDTKDDLDQGVSRLDPIITIHDPQGALVARGDDETECTYPPTCGWSCPRLQSVSCGDGGLFSLVVRDYGSSNIGDAACEGGGGYELDLEVTNSAGVVLPPADVKLGGGAVRDLPAWLRSAGFSSAAPALDDENVPLSSLMFRSDTASPSKVRKDGT